MLMRMRSIMRSAVAGCSLATTMVCVMAVLPAEGAEGHVSAGANGIGHTSTSAPSYATPSIVGGKLVADGAMPFVVSLQNPAWGTRPIQRHFCGGSLIAPSYVLTAAHCMQNLKTVDPGVVAVIGRASMSGDDGQEVSVRRVTVHPKWNRLTNEYDVAVLELAHPVVGITPVALPKSGVTTWDQPGTIATALGWGSTEPEAPNKLFFGLQPTDVQDRLNAVDVPILPDTTCQSGYRRPNGDSQVNSAVMLCASGRGKDACQGDSGGPLIVMGSDDRPALVGTTSFGNGCAASRYPGVYTRLTSHALGDFVRSVAR
jgi:secreted trypsin-like serine protease